MKTLIGALALAGLASCVSEQSYRLVDEDFLAPGADSAIPFPVEQFTGELDADQQAAFEQQYGDGAFVIAEEEDIVVGAPSLPLTVGQAQGGDLGGGIQWDVDAIGEAGIGALGTIFPQILPFAPALLLLFRRSRKHLASALGKALPRPGASSIDLIGAAQDTMRAVGLLHSSPTTEFVTENNIEVVDDTDEWEWYGDEEEEEFDSEIS